MVRQIGISDYGLYTLVTAFLTYFLIDFGFGSSIARFMAKYMAEGQPDQISNLLGIAARIYILLDIIIVIILLVVYFYLEGIFSQLNDQEIAKFKVIYCIAGVFSVLSFPLIPVQGAMIANEKFVVDKISNLAQKVIIIFLMVTALLLGYGLFALVLVNGITGLGIKLFKFVYLKKQGLLKINYRSFDRVLLKELFSFSIWIFIIGIAQRLLISISPTILGIFSGTEQIAVFGIAIILEGYIWTIANAINGLFLPRLTEIVTKNGSSEVITNLMIKVGRIQLFIMGMLITGIVVLGKPFVLLWMGESFKLSYSVALFLIVPGLITLTQEIASTMIVVVNKVRIRAILFVSAAVISVIISSLLASEYGAVGPAIGIATALVLSHIIGMNIVYFKVLKLDIMRFFKSVHLKMLWPMLVTVMLSVFFQFYIPINSWESFLVSGICFTSVYSILMWLFVMNSFEKELVRSIAKDLLKIK